MSKDAQFLSDRTFNEWRALTIDVVSKIKDNEANIGHGENSEGVGKSVEQESNVKRVEAVRRTWVASREIAKDIMKVVEIWAPESELDRLYTGLIELTVRAIDISQVMRRQRALWTLRHPSDCLTKEETDSAVLKSQGWFEDKADEDEEQSEQAISRVVGLVVSPGLFKRGNADGERYDIESCIKTAEVSYRKQED